MNTNAAGTSDAGLVARVLAQGDQQAFGQLVLRHQSAIRRWTRRFCNGDAAAGDDLAQEVFIKAYRALGQYRGESRFSTWLYRIAFNLAVAQKRLRRAQWELVEWDDEGDLAAQRETPQAADDLRRDLDAALATLSEAQRVALYLALDEGMSHDEIATVMALPLGTVKAHLGRGKHKLRQQLAAWRETD